MPEPLSIGWRKNHYSYREAELIVCYWRYDGPHPAKRDKPSYEALHRARADLASLARPVGQREPPEPPASRRASWIQGWRPDARSKPRRALPMPSGTAWIERADLEALCPGVFGGAEAQGEPPMKKRTGTTREINLVKAIKAALAALSIELKGKRDPSAMEVFSYLEEDPLGIVVESQESPEPALCWDTSTGKTKWTTLKTISNHLTNIRNAEKSRP